MLCKIVLLHTWKSMTLCEPFSLRVTHTWEETRCLPWSTDGSERTLVRVHFVFVKLLWKTCKQPANFCRPARSKYRGPLYMTRGKNKPKKRKHSGTNSPNSTQENKAFKMATSSPTNEVEIRDGSKDYDDGSSTTNTSNANVSTHLQNKLGMPQPTALDKILEEAEDQEESTFPKNFVDHVG